jgi:hypothetical protein
MTMPRVFLSLIFALALAGCRSAPQVAGLNTGVGAPSIFVAAQEAKVQQVIIARAAAKGSIIKPSSNGQLVLERPLEKPSAEVIAACGESWFGRKVRVVISLQVINGGTQVSERRYIVGGASISGGDCAMPLSPDDYAQSMNALGEVKARAEADTQAH